MAGRCPSKENIDAVCNDRAGHQLAIEHTRIEPFEGEKKDAARFLKTATLENHSDLLLSGYSCNVSQAVGAIPTGIDWAQVPKEQVNNLETVSRAWMKAAVWYLRIEKSRVSTEDRRKFWTSRIWPGDPGPELIITALERKIPKLALYAAYKKILLPTNTPSRAPSKANLRNFLIAINESMTY